MKRRQGDQVSTVQAEAARGQSPPRRLKDILEMSSRGLLTSGASMVDNPMLSQSHTHSYLPEAHEPSPTRDTVVERQMWLRNQTDPPLSQFVCLFSTPEEFVVNCWAW